MIASKLRLRNLLSSPNCGRANSSTV
jgi:hypothetical protein